MVIEEEEAFVLLRSFSFIDKDGHGEISMVDQQVKFPLWNLVDVGPNPLLIIRETPELDNGPKKYRLSGLFFTIGMTAGGKVQVIEPDAENGIYKDFVEIYKGRSAKSRGSTGDNLQRWLLDSKRHPQTTAVLKATSFDVVETGTSGVFRSI